MTNLKSHFRHILLMVLFSIIPIVLFGQDWVEHYTFSSDYTFNKLFFINADSGFIIGNKNSEINNGIIGRTIDGGENWLLSSIDSVILNDIALTNNKLFIVGTNGLLLTSIDMGQSWKREDLNVSFNFINISTVNNTIFLATASNSILKSIDDENWQLINGKYYHPMFGVVDVIPSYTLFLSDSVGYSASNDGYIYKTTDGGENWYTTYFDASGIYRKIYMLNDEQIFVAGGNFSAPYVLQLPDKIKSGGISGNDFIIQDICFTDENTGYCVSKGIWKTLDGGATFYREDNVINKKESNWGYSYDIYSIVFPEKNTGYAIGIENILYKTDSLNLSLNNIHKVKDKGIILNSKPNPFIASTEISFHLNKPEIINTKLIDMKGQIIYQNAEFKCNKGWNYDYLDLSNYPSGIYLYILNINNKKYSKTIIKSTNP
ncbi:YCF48-related protein [Saccharicrinis sp. FJH62]|uniref:YCF48-related protein n=1 Tax=Saccharicrinis sp. FJH62 TaxID=3344657 RepID=UPI0035D3F655